MKWVLNRFRESAFPFCNADFHRSISFVSRLNLMLSALCTLTITTCQPRRLYGTHHDCITTWRFYNKRYYTQRFFDNPTSWVILQDDWEKVGYRIYQKMIETKASPLVSSVLDFRHRTVTFTFSFCFHSSKLIYQLTFQKSHLSKQSLFLTAVSANKCTSASGRMQTPYSQEAQIPRIHSTISYLKQKLRLRLAPFISWLLGSFPNCL